MTNLKALPQINEIVTRLKERREVLEDYKTKMVEARANLKKARADRQTAFSFETDSKVIELENFIPRIEHRYNELKQEFDNELPKERREVESLFDSYQSEKWATDTEVKELTQALEEHFKTTVDLLNQCASKPADIYNEALKEIRTEDFAKAFSGEMLYFFPNYSLANILPIKDQTYKDLYSAGKQLGVKIED